MVSKPSTRVFSKATNRCRSDFSDGDGRRVDSHSFGRRINGDSNSGRVDSHSNSLGGGDSITLGSLNDDLSFGDLLSGGLGDVGEPEST